MRTDTQRLDFLLQVMEQQDEAAAERIQGAFMLDLKGRTALDAAMGAKLIEPGEPMPALTAIDLAAAELGRIRNVKGFSEERDDLYVEGQLGQASVCYLDDRRDPLLETAGDGVPFGYPWPDDTFKPSPDDRKKELTKGIALALCELDRVIRAERRESLDLQADVCREMNEAACEPEDVQPQPREFRVGDRVRIARKVTKQPGWNNSWESPEMDRAIGSSGVIERISDYGVEVLGIQYKWPSSSLEHADG